MWYDLLKIKNIYLQGRTVSIKNGEAVRFWWHPWLYDLPLKECVPVLFELSENKNAYVAQVKNGEINMQFRGWLQGELAVCWDKIRCDVENFPLINEADLISWKFSVKSVYNGLTKNDSGLYHKRIWKGKIPPKIKIFLWLLYNDAVLTKDNLIRRRWIGDPKCMFCEEDENITHLFFQCPTAKVIWSVIAVCFGANNIPTNLTQCWNWCEKWLPFGKKYHPWEIVAFCWAIWKSRNKACFEGKKIKSPIEIFCHACALMNFWTGHRSLC
jgi:hypothetical protein